MADKGKTPSGKPPTHYGQAPLRRAEFIKPLNTLKSKVGYGGLSDDILNKAQALLENNTADFLPLAEMYLASLMKGIDAIRRPNPADDSENLIAGMLYPAMQLKANGGMFRYPLITRIGDKLIQFLEVIANPDSDALEIIIAFHTTMRAVILGRVTGSGGKHGDELAEALEAACHRYFQQKPDNHSGIDENYTTEF